MLDISQLVTYRKPDAVRRLLADAGFGAVDVEVVRRTVRMSDGAAIFSRLNAMAIVGISPAAKAMRDEQRADVVAAVANDSIDAVQPYVVGSDLVFDLASTIAIARA